MNEKYIHELKEIRENLKLSRNVLLSDLNKQKETLKLIDDAYINLSKVLFELTDDKFFDVISDNIIKKPA